MDQQDSHNGSSFLDELEARQRARSAHGHLAHEQRQRDLGYGSMRMANGGTSSPSMLPHMGLSDQLQPDMYPSSLPLFNRHYEDSFSSQGDLSITQSLRSPGQFGTTSDWSQPQLLRQSHVTRGTMRDVFATPHDQRESIEFTPQLPPSSLPLFPAPITRPTRPYAQPQPRDYSQQSLHDMQMLYGGAGHGSTIFMNPGQMIYPSTGFVSRPTHWSQPPIVQSLPTSFLNQWVHVQNDPPVQQQQRRRNSSDSSGNEGSLGSSRGSSATVCSYCLSVGKPSDGHNKYNCHVLAQLPPCRSCHAWGKYNHTESHCPNLQKEELEFIPKDKRNRRRFDTV